VVVRAVQVVLVVAAAHVQEVALEIAEEDALKDVRHPVAEDVCTLAEAIVTTTVSAAA